MPKRMLSPNAPAAKKTKYFAKFQNAWKSEFKWCQASSKGPVFSVLRLTIQQCHQYKPDTDVVKAAKKACTPYLNQVCQCQVD